MTVFFTADLHLGHANILKYCKRPFLSAEERRLLDDGVDFKPSKKSLADHDYTILDRLNSRVDRDDQLRILGDFCLGTPERIQYYRDLIRCNNVYLIWGNHDHSASGRYFLKDAAYEHITVDGQLIFMCHYPMRSWYKSHRGSWHLYGHVHGGLPDIPYLLTLDVGVDTHNFYPWSFNEVKGYMHARLPAWEEHKKSWKSKDRGGMAPLVRG
jgi:calcineurin-like phosphoesterase family protein